MGANIEVEKFSETRYGTKADIKGPTQLVGTNVRALDIRAGAGMVLAGLAATGRTTVSDVHHLDRGYEGLVPKLRQIGAHINVTGPADTSESALARG
jgi:UDP-N-acetylglucosamine 1-carboxyvinyltransferase